MKVAFANTGDASGRDLQKHARELEKEGEFEKAVPLYKRMIKMHYRRNFWIHRHSGSVCGYCENHIFYFPGIVHTGVDFGIFSI